MVNIFCAYPRTKIEAMPPVGMWIAVSIAPSVTVTKLEVQWLLSMFYTCAIYPKLVSAALLESTFPHPFIICTPLEGTLKTKTWSKLVKWVLRMGRG